MPDGYHPALNTGNESYSFMSGSDKVEATKLCSKHLHVKLTDVVAALPDSDSGDLDGLLPSELAWSFSEAGRAGV